MTDLDLICPVNGCQRVTADPRRLRNHLVCDHLIGAPQAAQLAEGAELAPETPPAAPVEAQMADPLCAACQKPFTRTSNAQKVCPACRKTACTRCSRVGAHATTCPRGNGARSARAAKPARSRRAPAPPADLVKPARSAYAAVLADLDRQIAALTSARTALASLVAS